LKLTTHFAHEEVVRSEIAARHGIVQVATPEQMERALWLAVHVLEPIRTALAKPIRINSWLRTHSVNTLAGGAKDSAHLYGRAVDCECDMPNLAFAQFVRKLNLAELDKLILEFPDRDDPRAGWLHLQVARQGELPRGQVFTALHREGKTVYVEGLTTL